MAEPIQCGCGGKAAIYINCDTTMQGYCTVCGTVGPVADSTSEAITAWNTAMSKDLRDTAREWVGCRNGDRGAVPYQDVCDRLEKEATR